MWQILRKKTEMPSADRALPGRSAPAFSVPAKHFVNGNRIQPPFPAGLEKAMFGMGCFWGAERKFWEAPGVYATAVGYAAGLTPNPTYGKSARRRPTGSWCGSTRARPTRRCGCWRTTIRPRACASNDVGTQYRPHLHLLGPPEAKAEASRATSSASWRRRLGAITTRSDAPAFYYAEDYHQQYLAKNPAGYCGLGGTGVSCPIGVGVQAAD